MASQKQELPTSVRLTPELKKWLKHKAVDNDRSFNSEVIARLERSRKEDEGLHDLQP